MVERSNGTIIGGGLAYMMPSPMGWKARQQRATEKREQREAATANIRLRQHLTDRDRAQATVNAAIEVRDRLLERIAAAKGSLAVHRTKMMQTGVVPREMQSLTFGIEQAAALVEQSEAEIARTQAALDAAQRRLDDAMAAAAAAAAAVDDAEPQAEPVDETPKGRGRPRKVIS